MSGKSKAEILPTHTPELFREAVARAVELLCAGELVALPTETVYGLAANALDAKAVARIYEAKGRPAHNPIIVHVASLAMAKRCVTRWPLSAQRLAKAFWPGPLTLVLPRAMNIPDVVTAGGPTVGVRWSSHPFMQAVIRKCGFPLAAPSANPASRISPTTAEHVRRHLVGRLPLIVDGGPSHVGIESTVIDLTAVPPRVLRPGMVHEQALLAVTEQRRGRRRKVEGAESVLRSPGLLLKHYAPKAKLMVLAWRNNDDLKSQIANLKSPIATAHVIAHSRIPPGSGFGGVSVIPREAAAFARALYAELHRCDEAGAELIVVEAPPDSVEWRAIVDRLRRASAR
jgi:L-threonylcarbamoyladenylate synthase